MGGRQQKTNESVWNWEKIITFASRKRSMNCLLALEGDALRRKQASCNYIIN